MATEVAKNAVHMMARASRSPVYRAFGVGLDPLDLARRVRKLQDEEPPKCQLVFDLAGRVLFVDYLRFQTGWALEEATRDHGHHRRFDRDLDALETYLLCTCIDALGRRADTGFVGIFKELPDLVKQYIADGMVLIQGEQDFEQLRRSLTIWPQQAVDERVEKLARDFFLVRRRHVYTHEAHAHEPTSPGMWRRLAAKGALPHDEIGWRMTSLRSAKDPDKVRLTVLSRGSIDEGFLLRAIVAISVLRRVLKCEIHKDYLRAFFRYYETIEATYDFLNEMQRNRQYLEFLSAPDAVADYGGYDSHPLGTLSTAAGSRLLEGFDGLLEVLKGQVRSYLSQLDEVTVRVNQFNATHQPKVSEWRRWKEAIREFCRERQFIHLLTSVRWYHQWIYSSIRQVLHSGQLLSAFPRILPDWSVIWLELRRNLDTLPRCASHPHCPHVSTLSHGVINDIVEENESGITVRSHRTLVNRRVPAGVFEAWWNALVTCGRVSVASPPRTEHSRVVAAILATALPDRIRFVDGALLLVVQ